MPRVNRRRRAPSDSDRRSDLLHRVSRAPLAPARASNPAMVDRPRLGQLVSPMSLWLLTLAGLGCGRANAADEPPLAGSALPVAVASSAMDPTPATSVPERLHAAGCPDDMVSLAGGVVRMRRDHANVQLDPFCIDRNEVTVAQYAACVRAGGCAPECLQRRTCSSVPTRTAWDEPEERQRASAWCNGNRPDRQDHPVNCVSFDEGAQYCIAQGKRLPSAAEWEWAAGGGEARLRYPWGASAPEGAELCWGRPHGRAGTCVSTSFYRDKTPQGVLHMAGNLQEWTARNVDAPQQPAAVYGSSWWSIDDGYVGASLGGVGIAAERSEVFGFRCARGASRSAAIR